MRREVERDKNLPSFEMDVVEFGVLLQRLKALFDESEKLHCSIDFRLKNESLEFDSVEEIQNYKDLKGKVTSFRVWLSQSGKRLSINTSTFISSLVTVSAQADNEAWCAGAIETVYSYVLAHRTWYHWFIKWPFGTMLLIMVWAPTIISNIADDDPFKNETLSTAWLFLTLFLGALFISRGKILPVVTLRITNEENFIKRRAPELSLAIALLTAILTVAGWFIAR